MRISIRATFSLLLVMAMFSASRSIAHAQEVAPADKQPRAELALDYTYIRSNAPPGGCVCFDLNGGGATYAHSIGSGRFALVGDVSIAHAGAISANSYDLTLSTFTAGVRYRPTFRHSPLKPFGQVLAGIAHSSGSLVSGQNPTVSNSGGAFAAIAGGGLDLHLSHHFSVRLIEADYLVTTFDNGINDHQNNFRLNAGVVFHF